MPGNEAEGVQVETHATIWIEELSKTSCLAGVSVIKKTIELKFDQPPKLIKESRLEDKESEILEKMKKNLGIE